jgi:hypothetical protein
MEMMVRAHNNRVMSAGFITPMWPTEGPVDGVIRWICRLANTDHGNTGAPNSLPDESFGFVKSPPVWYVKLDLMINRPQYFKPTESLDS